MNFYIPTIEEIYNEYHKQTFYFMNGVYPRTIKNFDKILSDNKKKEQLLKFQNLIARNRESLDWKLYIYACASMLKQRFDLKILGSLAGNKLYRNYIKYTYNLEKSEQEIYDEIINSLKFLNMYFKSNNYTIKDYFLDGINTFPLSLKHLYAGTISINFYAALLPNLVYTVFSNYPDDVYSEFFQMTKDELLEIINNKRNKIISFKKLRLVCDKLEQKFSLETFNKQ